MESKSEWRVIGVDPGKNGCIAWIDEGGPYYQELAKVSDYGAVKLLRELETSDCFAYLEKVHSSPQMGVASAFTFGERYGFIRTALLASGMPYFEVTPQKWQAAIGCLSKGDKSTLKAAARVMFPSLNITLANADALLIAEYARRVMEACEGGQVG